MYRRNITQKIDKIYIISFLFLLTFLCHDAFSYNWPWDQGHDCVKTEDGWGKWDYNGKFRGKYTSKECCQLLCKICPVYANTGRFQQTYTDLTVPGIGPSLSITRTYTSQDWDNSLLGWGWTFNFGKRIIITRNKNGDKVIGVLLRTGEKNYYKENPDGSLERLTDYGATYQLIKNSDGTYTIRKRDGSRVEIRNDGKIERIVDTNQNALVFQYNSMGCLSRITNASGNYVDFQLGPNGKIHSITDNFGRTITYTYDQDANLVQVTDPLGNSVHYSYNSRHYLTRIVDARGNTVLTLNYDTHEPPRVASFTEKGETWTIAYYDGYTVKTDSHGHSWTYYYNDVGVIERVIDPLGHEVKRQLNKITATSTDWEEDRNGHRTTYTYDAEGNIASKTDPLGNTWTYSYVPGTSWIQTETNPLGVVTKYKYDSHGNLLKLIRDYGGPLQNTTVYTYDSHGRQTSVTDPLGYTTRYEYDSKGNLIKITNPLGHSTTFTYDARGNRLTSTDANGHTSTYAYDLLDRKISFTDSLGHTTRYSYDANGNLVAIHLSNGQNITQEYDGYNRLIRTTDPLGHSQRFSYDYNDNLIYSTDANGHTTTYTYDVLGRRVSMTDANNHTTTFSYDAAGNLISLTDAKGNTTTFSYDAANRMVGKTYPDGTSYAYSYDATGRKISQTDPNGNTINFSYDHLNRLVQKQYPDGTTAVYAYDLLGRLLSGRNTDSVIEYTYDALGRIITANQNGKRISYSYDAVGNRISMTTPESKVVQYEYNDNNFMTKIQLSNGKGISYSYDSLSRIIRKDFSNGMYTTMSFDNAGRLVNISYNKSDGTSIYSQTNTFDNMVNIVQKTTQEGITNYRYDNIYQLLYADHPSMSDEQFSYDPVGNRLTSSDFSDWTYNSRNELESYDGVAFRYDNNGNTIAKTDANGTTIYHYNYENRMIRVDLPGGNTASYKYDVLGRRIEKNVNGVMTQFLWDGNVLLAEYGSTGNLLRNYFVGAGDLNPSIIAEGGQVYFYIKDHLDSPQKLVDENGDIKWAGEYSAFGEVTVSMNDVRNNFRFPGQYLDGETGFYYNVHRYYDAGIGRYLREDPIGLEGGINFFVYVQNNPLNQIDLLGKLSCWLGEPLTMITAVGPFDAWRAKILADQALSMARTIGLSGIHNGPADAFRHCFWSCLMAQQIGVSQAKEVGNIHEDCNPNPSGERDMDLYNNSKGRSFGAKPGTSCKNACLQAACDGTLKTKP